MPIIHHFEEIDKVHKIDANREVDQIFSEVEKLFEN